MEKQALVLAGGGARAAYQVGCLRAIARLVPEGLPDARLHLKLSLHVAQRNSLAPGREVTVSLLADAIVPLADDGR